MGSPAYSTRFGVWHDDAGPESVGGPLSGQLWVIRDINVFNGNTLSGLLQFQLIDDDSLTLLWVADWSIGETGQKQFAGRIVVPEGNACSWAAVSSVGASGVDVYIGGYTLATTFA